MENTPQTNPFAKIKGIYIAIVWLFPCSFLFQYLGIYNLLSKYLPLYGLILFSYYFFHFVFILTLFTLSNYSNLNRNIFFQKRVVFKELIPGFKLIVFMLFFSSTTAFIIFFPLSYLFPTFVDWWYIQPYSVIYSDGQTYPVIANILSFLSVVVIAPITEEVAFRGFLLNRLAYKFSTTKAIILSSILFGVVHPEPISAIVFGIGMCVLYLRSHSLWIPILCHALSNLVAWMYEAVYQFTNGPTYVYTLQEFQSEWQTGIIFGVLSIVWIFVYLRNPVDIKKYRVPDVT